ncbi:MAG: YdcF family protein [Thermoguttaceae bacterium]
MDTFAGKRCGFRGRRRCGGLLLLAVAMTLLWSFRAPLLRGAAQWLDVGTRPQRADYVMVLNGEEATRPFVAAALVKDHWANRVLIAEVERTPDIIEGLRSPYHEINRRVIKKRAPAAQVTILPGQAATTYDEARALAVFLRSRPNARVLVVTSDYHTRRSRWAFSRALGERAGQVRFVSAPSAQFDMACWWLDERGLVDVATEYLKLAFYALCYGYVWQWGLACAGLMAALTWAKHREPTLPNSAEVSGH